MCDLMCYVVGRYGMAEMRNGRPYMEDRITACASFVELQKKKNVLLSLSLGGDQGEGEDEDEDEDEDGLLPPVPPMIGDHSVRNLPAAETAAVCICVILLNVVFFAY